MNDITNKEKLEMYLSSFKSLSYVLSGLLREQLFEMRTSEPERSKRIAKGFKDGEISITIEAVLTREGMQELTYFAVDGINLDEKLFSLFPKHHLAS